MAESGPGHASHGRRWRSRLLVLAAVVAGLALVAEGLHLRRRVAHRFPWARAAGVQPAAPPVGRTTARITSYPAVGGAAPLPVRLLQRPWQSRGDVRPMRVLLDGETRNAAGGSLPQQFSVTARVPEHAFLSVAMNQQGAPLGSSGIRFRILLDAGGRRTPLLDARIPPYASGWKQRHLDLAPWAGRTVSLRFEAAIDAGHPGPSAGDVSGMRAFWGDLVIRAADPSPERPNLIVILIDTLRPDHLGCYGYRRPTSPHLDALAREGVLFQRAFSVAPWTDPSILGLMTGLYPSDVWRPGSHREIIRKAIPSSVETMAEAASRAGWFTVAASDHPGINDRRFGQGFDRFVQLYRVGGPYTSWRKTRARPVLRQLDALLADPAPSGLLLYLHILYPHRPYRPPPAYAGLFGPGVYEIDRANRRGLVNLYDAEVRVADDVVGSFVDLLQRRGLLANSVLVVVADHGEGFWEHGLSEHGNSLYNELLHIPLLMVARGRLPAGRRIPDVVRIVDVMPTLLALAGIQPPSHLRGRSLLPLVDGAQGPPRLAFSEFPHSLIIHGEAVQSRTRKLIVADPSGGERRLYDLEHDPGEQAPLASAANHDGRLAATLRAIRDSADAERQTRTVEAAQPDPELLERLKSLGYVDQ